MAESPSHPERFDFAAPDAEFRVDRTRRRISGMVLPWGKVAFSGGFQWRFARSSVEVPADTGRVKLLKDHDPQNAVGKALGFEDRDEGLWAEFQVKRGQAGDEILSEAEDGVLDGFSVGPAFAADGWQADPDDPSVRLVHDARLVEVSIVAIPAFADARVASVVASQEGAEMATIPAREGDKATGDGAKPTVLEHQGSGMERFEAELDQRFAKMADKLSESFEASQESIAKNVADAFGAAFSRLEDVDAAGRGEAAAARFKVISEPPVYRFDGDSRHESLVRDAWAFYDHRDYDARDRLNKFKEQQSDLVKFATVTTGNASQVIPPGYRPDLYVTQLMQGRPIVAHASRGTISDATPFTVPRFVTATGATADHVEGVNPTDGTLTLDTVTVTPGGISGSFKLTREIVDAANPAIDAIAMSAMRESWNRQTEQKAYAAINNQAAAPLVTNVTQANLDLTTGLAIGPTRNLLAMYPFTRFAAPTGAVISQSVTRNFANAVDTTGRPLLPSIGATNTVGLGNAVQQGWYVDGLPFVPAWAMTETITDDVLIIINRNDFWVWESPLLDFRFEEKSGPALVELALFGYYATKVLRPAGLAALNKSA